MGRRTKPDRLGDCYEAAAKIVSSAWYHDHSTQLKLVHGEVAGQGPLEGTTFGHAWVLDGDTVIDRSNGRDIRMPRAIYYALGAIDMIGNTHEYTAEETVRKMVDVGTYGPWDLVTRSGL